MSVYTRTGDKGKTSLYGGKRVSKSSLRIEAIGTVDELNSVIGIAIAQVQNSKFKIQNFRKELVQIQNDLFDIGANLANPSSRPKDDLVQRNHQLSGSKPLAEKLEKRVGEFEKIIDDLTNKLPELQNFILPGGSLTGSQLHLARTIARRAERRIVELSEKENIESSIIIYMNRLSDLLFMIARFVNYKEKKKETLWTSR